MKNLKIAKKLYNFANIMQAGPDRELIRVLASIYRMDGVKSGDLHLKEFMPRDVKQMVDMALS